MMTHTEIRAWLDLMKIKRYDIQESGVVDVYGNVELQEFGGNTLPIQFGNVSGDFDCSSIDIISLKGAPQSVGELFDCSHTKITSLEYAPQSVGRMFFCNNTKITSLHDFYKQEPHIGGTFYCSGYVTHLLGLLLIDNIPKFNIDDGGPIDAIFDKYAKTGDILSAQDELIDAGFIEQARL
jgi:hypothetical protein